ncbi:MAG: hypothetical protein ACXADW_02615 [Candidatus Hodarchaeales archaeon]|jgi:hypothetical protein
MKKILPDDVASYINMTCDIEERNKSVIYENDLFICVKDIKHVDENDYHYTAWCKKDLRSLLDVERKHLKYIKNLKKVMYQKYQLTDENTENFIHFPPSYWRLHIHFVTRPHIVPVYHQLYFINDIINLLETNEDTYRTYVVIDKAKL